MAVVTKAKKGDDKPSDSVTLKLSWGDLTLHQPNLPRRRTLFGFTGGIYLDVIEGLGGLSRDPAVLAQRTAVVLMSENQNAAKCFWHAALLCGKADTIDDQAAIELASEMSQKATADDVVEIYAALLEFSGWIAYAAKNYGIAPAA